RDTLNERTERAIQTARKPSIGFWSRSRIIGLAALLVVVASGILIALKFLPGIPSKGPARPRLVSTAEWKIYSMENPWLDGSPWKAFGLRQKTPKEGWYYLDVAGFADRCPPFRNSGSRLGSTCTKRRQPRSISAWRKRMPTRSLVTSCGSP